MKPPSNRFPRGRVRRVIISAVIVLPIVVVVPVVLVVVPPAIIIKGGEISFTSRSAVVAVRAKVAQTGRPGIVAVVVVGPLARVRALDGRCVGVSAAAVGAIRPLLAHGSQEVVVVVTVPVVVVPVPAVVIIIIAVEAPIIVVEDLPILARGPIITHAIQSPLARVVADGARRVREDARDDRAVVLHDDLARARVDLRDVDGDGLAVVLRLGRRPGLAFLEDQYHLGHLDGLDLVGAPGCGSQRELGAVQ